jgi:hypothetical protein
VKKLLPIAPVQRFGRFLGYNGKDTILPRITGLGPTRTLGEVRYRDAIRGTADVGTVVVGWLFDNRV